MRSLRRYFPWLYWRIFLALRTDLLQRIEDQQEDIAVMLEKGHALYACIKRDDTESVEFQKKFLEFEEALECVERSKCKC